MSKKRASQPAMELSADLLGTAAVIPDTPAAPKRNIFLRNANALDVVALYRVLIRYFEELKLFYPAPVMEPTLAWGLGLILKGGVTLAIEDNKIIGSVGLEIGHFPWAPTMAYLNGVWFYVTPERRAGGTANQLMRAAKETGMKMNLPVRLDSIWGVEPELQDRYRKIHGFQYVGGNHVWFPKSQGAGAIDGQQHEGGPDH